MSSNTPGTIAPGVLDLDVSSLKRDQRWMHRCLVLAAGGAGLVSPNPLVGAVLVGTDGTVLGEGRHREYGGSHAEVNAVEEAKHNFPDRDLGKATLYVNLEPCNHWGKTPPCTDLILREGITKLVVGMVDPFPDAAGAGLDRLREHGLEVRLGVLADACYRLNESYLHHLETGRPLVTLKIAQTLDGAIATSTGESRWISGESSRALVHRWRASVDAVLVGTGTARSDDPRLTVRHVDGPQPLRVVLDRNGDLPADLRLFTDSSVERTIVVTGPDKRPDYASDLEGRGGRIVRVPVSNGHLDLAELLSVLGELDEANARTVQSLLVEAGTGLSTAFFDRGLVDRLFLFTAPKILGNGRPAVGDLGISRMEDARTFGEYVWKKVGNDMLFCGYGEIP